MNKYKLTFFSSLLFLLPTIPLNKVILSQIKNYNNVFPSWSPDRNKIAFQSDRDGDEEIYVMNSDGSEQKRITSVTGRDTHPNWSPDGKTIMFQSNRSSNDPHIVELYTMNEDGSAQKQITHLNKFSGVPVLSHDASKIIFQSKDYNADKHNEESFWHIYIMNSDGTGIRKLTNGKSNFQVPVWSPDDSKILYWCDSTGNNEIYVIDFASGKSKQLTFNSADDIVACWSPDGSKISFYSNRSGKYDLLIMDSDGSNQRILAEDISPFAVPFWSPDGKYILTTALQNNYKKIALVNMEGKITVLK